MLAVGCKVAVILHGGKSVVKCLKLETSPVRSSVLFGDVRRNTKENK